MESSGSKTRFFDSRVAEVFDENFGHSAFLFLGHREKQVRPNNAKRKSCREGGIV